MVGNPNCWFSHAKAKIVIKIQIRDEHTHFFLISQDGTVYFSLIIKTEPRSERTSLPTRSDTNWPEQLQKMARSLAIRFRKKRNYTIHVVKKKALISNALIAQLICTFVFA